ncbi:YihY/virulence factor BrkB family protein [Anaeromyxobacter sp. Fw109-5]|uniref:YihY/virulence factor BrkB family protein n=1 Tax=Anaeromyxobacter sp. (strain Fw109-5) TaxID=404589 RepID=UPI000158A7A3|nr:YihY/virulence factor BrkB family protein [Anaeromyxobacter sp. Fw109-5]ABS27206.1 putative ribonuclease BN [Anaeromyxobacter sp. Fw109-5]
MSWKEFGKGLKEELSKDQVTDIAATVTYYGVLSLFPFVLFLVALASVVIEPSDAERMVEELGQVAPGAVTQIIGDRIRQLGAEQNVSLLGFGAVAALWAASGGVTAVMRALNTAYDVKEGRPFWKVRGIAILMTLLAGALGLIAALVAIAAAPLAEAIGGPLGTAITWLRLPVAGLVMMLLWALVYYVLPDVEQRFRFITPGSVFGVLVWVLASWGFSRYVTSFGSYDKTYGSLAGVIVLLLWMWITSLVLLVGAEVNAFIEHRSVEGKRQGAKRKSDVGLAPAAAIPGKEPVPTGAAPEAAAVAGTAPTAEAALARAGVSGAPRGRAPAGRQDRPRLRGVMAIATGFMAGVLVARRSY